MAIAPISPPQGLAQSLTANALQTAQSAIANALNNQIEVGRQATGAFLQQERDFFTERARRNADERAQDSLSLRRDESNMNFVRALNNDETSNAFRERTTSMAEDRNARDAQTFERNNMNLDALDEAGLGVADTAQFNRDTAIQNRDMAKERNAADMKRNAMLIKKDELSLGAALEGKQTQEQAEEAAQGFYAEFIRREREGKPTTPEDLAFFADGMARSTNPTILAQAARIKQRMSPVKEGDVDNPLADIKAEVAKIDEAIAVAEAEMSKTEEGDAPRATLERKLAGLREKKKIAQAKLGPAPLPTAENDIGALIDSTQ